jgi:hypothetical protein
MSRTPPYVYEDFTQNLPDEETRKRHQEARNQVMKRRFEQRVRRQEHERAKNEPYAKALGQFLAAQEGFAELPSVIKPLARKEHPPAPATAKQMARLSKRFFKSGSCVTIDPPTSLEPFISWSGTETTPIGASATPAPADQYKDPTTKLATFSDPATGVLTCSLSGGADYNIPGTAQFWGYMGKYYGSPQNLPAGQIGQVIVTSFPLVKYQAIENITSFLGAGGGAGLQAQASIWVPVYDNEWNHIADYNSAPVDIILPGTIDIDPPLDLWTPPFLYPLSLTVVIQGGQNVGVFVEIYANAWGSGGSTGAWDFVGTASIALVATVPSIMLEVQEWVQP